MTEKDFALLDLLDEAKASRGRVMREAFERQLLEAGKLGAQVAITRPLGGAYRCVLSGVGLPPHHAEGATVLEALDEALRFARKIGVGRPSTDP